MRHSSQCCLCSQIAGYKDNDLIAEMLPGRPYVRRVMMETASFAVIPSLGALVPGHSLVCPKPHIRSFSQLSASKYAEFQQLKEDLRPALERLYNTGVHLFEHGMAAEGNRVPCTVDHAHMHFLPLPEAFDLDAVRQLAWVPINGSVEAMAAAAGKSEYIFYEDSAGRGRILRAGATGFESQYMRRLLAGALPNSGNWNWREHPDAGAADAAWRRFVAAAPELRG
jgi:diadenosine tetraphosphate (Ap4A) HIT family hydrolase